MSIEGYPFRRTFAGFPWGDPLVVSLHSAERVVACNAAGNVMLDCSRWLFDQCWQRGWFV